MSLLGLDVGTTGCKALLLAGNGRVQAVAYREYPLEYPRPGWAELDPLAVWQAVCETVREAAAGSGGSEPIKALSISSHGESITPVDSDGRPLHKTIVSLDTRTIPCVETWDNGFGRERLECITGIPLHHKHSINRIMWLRTFHPEVFHAAWKFLCYEDFVLCQMGLEPVISTSLAARTMAYDSALGDWSDDVLSFAGVDRALLPRIQPSATAVGRISDRVAATLGLDRGVLAVTGGHDQPCGALGAGIIGEGPAVDSIGTVEALTTVAPGTCDHGGLLTAGYPRYPHVVPGEMVTMAVNPNAGALFRWYRDNLAGDERREAAANGQDPYGLIVGKCDHGPSSILVLPHFSGSGTPCPNPGLRGAFLGMGLGTTRHDIAWGILESAAFELRLNVTALGKQGVGVSELTAVGGGARSVELLQLRANVLGLPVKRPAISEAACLGAALLAGVGSGEFRSAREATASLPAGGVEVEPQPEMVRLYDDKFEIYHQMRHKADESGQLAR